MSELSRVMIHKTSGRVLKAACWSCGKSDTYCDGRWDSDAEIGCCETCDTAKHNAHTGELTNPFAALRETGLVE